LTKEVFQRVSGNYRNNFCQKVVYWRGFSSQSTATVVILMGMSKLEEIVSIFQSESRWKLRLFKTVRLTRRKLEWNNKYDSKVVAENKLSSPAIV
jgi:uroporphyrin-III C-methyltransferase